MKNNEYHTVPKSNRKIEKIGKILIPLTQIHDCTLSWLGTGTSKKNGRVKPIDVLINK